MRTEEKKRESSKQKEVKEPLTAPVTPVLPTPTAETHVDTSLENVASPAPELQKAESPVEQKQEEVPSQADEKVAKQDASNSAQDTQNQSMEVI